MPSSKSPKGRSRRPYAAKCPRRQFVTREREKAQIRQEEKYCASSDEEVLDSGNCATEIEEPTREQTSKFTLMPERDAVPTSATSEGSKDSSQPAKTTKCATKTRRISGTAAEVTKTFHVRTSMPCPCELETCKELIKIGQYGYLGDGRSACVHCGKGVQRNGLFRGAADLIKHVQSAKCQESRGLKRPRQHRKRFLGAVLSHEVSDPRNQKAARSRGGKATYIFRCPKCTSSCAWSQRYVHAIDCYPKHGVSLPIQPKETGTANKTSLS